MNKGVPAGIAALVIAFGTGSLTACSAPAQRDTRVAYCTDAAGKIIDSRSCDQSAKGYYQPGSFIWVGNYPTGMRAGQTMDWGNTQYGGQRATASDTIARSSIGIAPTGKVATGTKGGIGIGKTSTGSGPGVSDGGSGSGVTTGKSGTGGAKGGVGGGAHGSSGS